MIDLITQALLRARSKGKLKRIDVVNRYLTMKYRLNLSQKALNRRIQGLETLKG